MRRLVTETAPGLRRSSMQTPPDLLPNRRARDLMDRCAPDGHADQDQHRPADKKTPATTSPGRCGRVSLVIDNGARRKRRALEVRQRLLDAIYGQCFRRVLRDLGLTSNQIWD